MLYLVIWEVKERIRNMDLYSTGAGALERRRRRRRHLNYLSHLFGLFTFPYYCRRRDGSLALEDAGRSFRGLLLHLQRWRTAYSLWLFVSCCLTFSISFPCIVFVVFNFSFSFFAASLCVKALPVYSYERPFLLGACGWSCIWFEF